MSVLLTAIRGADNVIHYKAIVFNVIRPIVMQYNVICYCETVHNVIRNIVVQYTRLLDTPLVGCPVGQNRNLVLSNVDVSWQDRQNVT